MEFILEVILQCCFEFLLQLFTEVFCELGFQSFTEVFKDRRLQNPWLAGTGYFMLGAAAGGISLLIFKSTLIHNSKIRVLNLFLTPVLAGLLMALIGWWRRKKRAILGAA